MTSADISELRKKYQEAGQEHVFTFWNSLNDHEKNSLLDQLHALDPKEISEIATDTVLNPKPPQSPSKIAELPDRATASVVDSASKSPDEQKQQQEWYDLGLDLVASNLVAVVLLAGGQGTRLGSSDPKGCYNVGLPSGKSLFQLQAERIKKLAQLAEHAKPNTDSRGPVRIPWYIMTSGATAGPTKEFFEKNKYFGLDPKDIIFFEQGVLPCLDSEGKIIMQNKYTLATAPDGNGGVYTALHKNGILDDMRQRGIQHIHTYCVDNCLVRVADPVFIGFAAQRKLQIGTKVVRKRDATESVGLIVSKASKPAVIEYSEVSPQLASATTPEGLLRLRAANIVNHYYSADFLYSIPTWKSTHLPFHIAYKKIPHIDLNTGELIEKPSEPNGYKLEQFVFDVFPCLTFDEFAAMEVERHAEFSPLKNASGTKNDNPETSRRDLINQWRKWLIEAGATVPDDIEVEISPLTSYGGEGLEKFRNKTITDKLI